MYVNAVGFRRADHSLKLGKMFTPEEALKLNLVNDLVDSPAELMEKAEQEMEKWLKVPGMFLLIIESKQRSAQIQIGSVFRIFTKFELARLDPSQNSQLQKRTFSNIYFLIIKSAYKSCSMNF